MFAVRVDILREIMANPTWSKKLKRAKTSRDVSQVIQDYCFMRGYHVTYH